MDTDGSFDIEAYLLRYSGQQIYYFANPGNGGDCVISSGAHALLEKIGLNYITISQFDYDVTGCIVFYAGGGNLVNPNTFSSRFLNKIHKVAKKVVVFPHTLKNIDKLLSDFGGNVDVICREKTSYTYAKSIMSPDHVFLSHDMAFCLDAGRILSVNVDSLKPHLSQYLIDRYFRKKGVVSWRGLLRSLDLRRRLKKIESATVGEKDLYCFRMDGESIGFRLPDKNFDLSLIFDFGTATKEISLFTTYTIFSLLRKYENIHTDRLHMAISGALLGLNVNFYSNNYFKCKAVYEYSIREKYPNVRWMGQNSPKG